MLMVDMAHIAGLVAARPPPEPRALCRRGDHHHPQDPARPPRRHDSWPTEEYRTRRINSTAIFPGTQGGPLEHVIAGKAVCLGEALKPEFKEYAATDRAKTPRPWPTSCCDRGVKLVSGGTDNHLMLIDLTDEDCTGKELEHSLDEVHITANKNTVPGEKRSPFVTSGVRVGTPAVDHPRHGPRRDEDYRGLHRGLYLRFRGQEGRSRRPRSRAGEEVPAVRVISVISNCRFCRGRYSHPPLQLVNRIFLRSAARQGASFLRQQFWAKQPPLLLKLNN